MIDFDNNSMKYTGMSVPNHTKDTIEGYLLKGYRPGGFVTAMLAYDYARALYAADTTNRQMFWAIAVWIRDYAPSGSHGSYESVDNWVNDVDGIRTKFSDECEKRFVWTTLGEVQCK